MPKLKGEKDNMCIWDAVCETDPKYTKQVNQRGGFTAIGAQSQIKKATEVFGAYGYGWGVKDERIDKWEDCGLVVYQATLWYLVKDKAEWGEGEVPIHSSIKYSSNGRVDDDFFKKVATDALTKGLSKLGFNADVFMGMFDDNKYVNQMANKFKKETSVDVKKKVVAKLRGIDKTNDFYVKVIHALDNGKINESNLDSSLKKIEEFKASLKAQAQEQEPETKPEEEKKDE